MIQIMSRKASLPEETIAELRQADVLPTRRPPTAAHKRPSFVTAARPTPALCSTITHGQAHTRTPTPSLLIRVSQVRSLRGPPLLSTLCSMFPTRCDSLEQRATTMPTRHIDTVGHR